MTEPIRDKTGDPAELVQDGPFSYKVNTPEFRAAEEKADAYCERLFTAGSTIIDELVREVESMPIASRFITERKMTSNDLRQTGSTQVEVVDPNITEPAHKRQALLENLKDFRQAQQKLAERLIPLIMDIEATKTEG